MNVRRIDDPFRGEQAVAVHPRIAPRVEAGWMRRLNLFTGRALSDTALTAEQEGRAGRLATAGQAFSAGIVAGLEVDLETETVADPEAEGGIAVRRYVHVSPGFGLTASGEDVVVATTARIPLADLWVHLTPPSPMPDMGGAPASSEVPALPLVPLGDALPLRPPTMQVPDFRGPLSALIDRGTEMPRVFVLVLEPVTARIAGGADPRDPCERDPRDDAFADWQLADGARLSLYGWPWPAPWTADPVSGTGRNELASLVFRAEAAYGPGEVHPWEERGVPLGLLAVDDAFRPRWLDVHSVVRDGGRPRRRNTLVAGEGSPFLWQARMRQFAEQAAAADWAGTPAGEILAPFRHLPPAGLLPRAAATEAGVPRALFPEGWAVDAVPVPVEQLDVALEASAPLAPYDLAEPDRVRILVPVPGAWFEPGLLLTEQVAPEFQQAIDWFVARRAEYIARREDLRRKAEALVEAAVGAKPFFERPERDPERLEDEGAWFPAPRTGTRAHVSAPREGHHGHAYRQGPMTGLYSGDTLYAWVYLSPVHTPRQVMLSLYAVGRGQEYRAWWGEDLIPPTGDVRAAARVGDLPATGEWVRLEVPADALGLPGVTVHGMGFHLFDGSATWDRAGHVPNTDQVWMDEAVPQGAVQRPVPFTWVRPTGGSQEYHGNRALQVEAGKGIEQRWFEKGAPLTVLRGESLLCDVYLEPVDERGAESPGALLLAWFDGTWEHRAYWGSDQIAFGKPGSPGWVKMGDLPPAGRWVRLVVPAAAVGLEDRDVTGMSFSVLGRTARFDRAGVRRLRARRPGTGLLGRYFTDDAFGAEKLVRVDGELDLMPPDRWGRFDPVLLEGVRSIRWTGQITPRFTDSYGFLLGTEDARLHLRVSDPEGQPLVNLNTATTPPTYPNEWHSSRVALRYGVRYDVTLEWVRAEETGRPPEPILVAWGSQNQFAERLGERDLYPSATAGVGEGPPLEVPWLEDETPAGATLTLPAAEAAPDEGWRWGVAPVLVPPEDDYRTRLDDGERRALPLEELRERLAASPPLQPEDLEALDAEGLSRFIDALEARVRRADDVVNFGFVRVQSDMYRLRQLMLGTTAATRLATSPALASIINSDSAKQVREELLGFLRTNTIAANDPSQDEKDDAGAPRALRDEPAAPALTFSAKAAAQASTLSTGIARFSALSSLSKRITAQPATTQKATFTAALAGTDTLTGGTQVGTAAKAALSGSLFSAPVQAITVRRPTVSDVLLKQPIVGETYDFRTVTVGERLETPPANEAKSFTLLTRYEVLRSLAELRDVIHLDDIRFPGFLRREGDEVVYRPGFAVNHRMVRIPVREARRFDLVRTRLEEEILGEKDREDADEPEFFSIGVELLDATIAALRAVEGRIQQYRDVLEACRETLEELHALARRLDVRLKEVEDELAEARHDVTVSRALLAEETRRVNAINDRRRTILRRHVSFLAYHRPREASTVGAAPARPVHPRFTQDPVPAALADTSAAPAELRDLVELLREAPVRWFLGLSGILDKLDNVDVLLGTLAASRDRALGRLNPKVLGLSPDGQGRLGEALVRRFAAQQQVVGRYRAAAAGLDLARFAGQAWRWIREQAEEVLSLGDLIDAPHGRSQVDRAASRALDEVLRVATALYERFGEVPPSVRLVWADRLSQFDDEREVDLRNLYSLPRWGELEYREQREAQALVDWLFQRMDPRVPEARALMNDVVRACLLLASHAPVNQLLGGTLAREAEAREGALVRIEADLAKVRIGMQVILYDAQQRPVRAVVEDIDQGMAVTRVVQAPERVVTLAQGTRAQIGDERRLGRVETLASAKGQVVDAARERVVARMGARAGLAG